MTDRELIEAAAKAAGLWDYREQCIDIPWNPLNDDGDALRLAVKLKLNIGFGSERLQGSHWDHVEAFAEPDEDGRSFCPSEEMGSDPSAAVMVNAQADARGLAVLNGPKTKLTPNRKPEISTGHHQPTCHEEDLLTASRSSAAITYFG